MLFVIELVCVIVFVLFSLFVLVWFFGLVHSVPCLSAVFVLRFLFGSCFWSLFLKLLVALDLVRCSLL